MALFNYRMSFLAMTHPRAATIFYQEPQPNALHFAPAHAYSYPVPQKPFLSEKFLRKSHKSAQQTFNPSQIQQFQHSHNGAQHSEPVQPTFTKVTDDATKTKVYDNEKDPEVTPIQGPIFIKSGSVPVVPRYSHRVLKNGSFVQIPILWTALSVAMGVPCIKRNQQLYCSRAGNSYPFDQIELFTHENKAMVKRMYGDFDMAEYEPDTSGPNPRKRRSTKPGVPGVYFDPGPDPEKTANPFEKKNSNSRQNFRQNMKIKSERKNSTKRCSGDCGCEQKYKLYRLLVYDPDNDCKGIFMEWFLFPSCCVCRCNPNS